MSVITKVPVPNIFEEICKEYSQFKQFREEDEGSVCTEYLDFDPALHNPVFYGKMHEAIKGDIEPVEDVDPATVHPSVIGYVFTEKPPKSPTPPPTPTPKKDECSPREYLEIYVFPILLPALEAMLKQAKVEKCFERKRTKFNALDFLTESLYKNNPNETEREKLDLWDIPFVKEWLKDHPRPPLPLSLIWTEEEAALKIQAFWRGYLVRREPDVQELRQWQREWQDELHGNIKHQVNDFWQKQMPAADTDTPTASQDNLTAPTTGDNPATQDSLPSQDSQPAQDNLPSQEKVDNP